ncbi:MAG: hypothetical protein J6X55_05075 [Victivallales bacterium]|nr:hypothetical protein [Victivallales bacterium]
MKRLALITLALFVQSAFVQCMGDAGNDTDKVEVTVLSDASRTVCIPGGWLLRVLVRNSTQKDADIAIEAILLRAGNNDHLTNSVIKTHNQKGELEVHVPGIPGELRERVKVGETRILSMFLPLSDETAKKKGIIASILNGIRSSYMQDASYEQEGTVYRSWKVSVNGKVVESKSDEGNVGAMKARHLFMNAHCLCSKQLCDQEQLNNFSQSLLGDVAETSSNWPDDYRPYLAYSAIWLTACEWAGLSNGVRDALCVYEKLGGTVVVAANEDDRQQKNFTKEEVTSLLSKVVFKKIGLGRMVTVPSIVCMEVAAKSLLQKGIKSKDYPSELISGVKLWNLQGSFLQLNGYDEEDRLIDNDQRQDVNVYVIGLLLSVLVLGPGVFWGMKLWKKPLLPLLVTPALAISVSLLLVIVRFFSLEFDSECKLTSVVWLDNESGEFVSQGLIRGKLRSVWKKTLEFDDDCMVSFINPVKDLSVRVSAGRQMLSADFSDDESPIKYSVRYKGKTENGIQVTFDDEGCTVTNRLGVPLAELIIAAPHGEWFGDLAIGAGETKRLAMRGRRGKWDEENIQLDAVQMVMFDTSEKAIWHLVHSGALAEGEFAAVTTEPFCSDYGFKANSSEKRVIVMGTYGRK